MYLNPFNIQSVYLLMHYPLELFGKEVEDSLKEILSSMGYKERINLEIPPSSDKGDYAFACFPLSKILRLTPDEIAKKIASEVKTKGWIDKVIAERGYVNFFINREKLVATTIEIIRKMDESYGMLDKKNIKMIIEHTSANPNGPLHVGRARNPILGDTLVRLYKFAGYDVETQFYVDDLGKQVAMLAWGINNIDPKTLPEPSREKLDHVFVRFYQKTYQLMEENESISDEIAELVRECERGNKKALQIVKEAYEKVLEGIKQSLLRLNIHFDTFVPESMFIRDGSVNRVVDNLKKSKYAGNEGGAWYIDLESFGITGRNTKFFFTRSDGTTLYATRDIAYHLWKAERANMLLNILGEDHKLEAKQVQIALKLLNAKVIPKAVFYAFVTLPGGKMSTRRGRAVYLDDLIDEAVERAYAEVKKRREELPEDKIKNIAEIVGIGAVRYNIIKVQPEKEIVFKWEDALNFEGNSAPFIQYAHARACSILRKEEAPEYAHTNLLSHEQEVKLVKILARFPEVIGMACNSNKPNLVANYLFDLASQFNQFYRDCPVLKAENSSLKKARLALVDATRITLRNGLSILGIKAPEEM